MISVWEGLRWSKAQMLSSLFSVAIPQETGLSSPNPRLRDLHSEHNTCRFQSKRDCGPFSWKEALGRNSARLASWIPESSPWLLWFFLIYFCFVCLYLFCVYTCMHVCVLSSIKRKRFNLNGKLYPSILLGWFGSMNVESPWKMPFTAIASTSFALELVYIKDTAILRLHTGYFHL